MQHQPPPVCPPPSNHQHTYCSTSYFLDVRVSVLFWDLVQVATLKRTVAKLLEMVRELQQSEAPANAKAEVE